MAYFPKMTITNAGLKLLTNVQVGADTITFTKMVLGDGETPASVSALTAVVNPIIECDVTFGKNIGDNTYQIGAYFSNSSIVTGFWWREVGVFAKGKDGKEILYSYTNAGDAGDYIPVGADERVEKYIYNSLAVGNAESVTIEVNESEMFITEAEKGEAHGVAPLNGDKKIDTIYLPEMDYADRAEFESLSDNFTTHKNATNPHNIKPSTIGLGNVPNVSTNDQTPTYTEATTLTALTSGEKLSVAFGKIKKAITDLISHIADTTKHITSSERSTWNGKAPTSHASNATTYGVGTSSNYGHLKITDSLTSTDADTAASAAAIKTVHEMAQSGMWKAIKEVDVALNTNGGNSVAIDLSSIVEHSYSELRMVFEGDITMTATSAGDYGANISLSCGATDTSGLLAMFAGNVASRTSGKTWKITNMSAEMYAERLKYYTYSESYAAGGDILTSSTQKNCLACRGRQSATPVLVDADKFKLILSTSQTNITVVANGTLKIYKRG